MYPCKVVAYAEKEREDVYFERVQISIEQFQVFSDIYCQSGNREKESIYDNYAGAFIDEKGYLNIGLLDTDVLLNESGIFYSESILGKQTIHYIKQAHSYVELNEIVEVLNEVDNFDCASYGINNRPIL